MLICILVVLVPSALAHVPYMTDSQDQHGPSSFGDPTPFSQDGRVPEGGDTPALTDAAAPFGPEIMWQTCLGGRYNEQAYSIIENCEGDYAVVGYTKSRSVDVYESAQDVWIAEISTDGSDERQIWGEAYWGDAYSIIHAPSSEYLATGTILVEVTDDFYLDYDLWVPTIWESVVDNPEQKCLGGSGEDCGMCIIEDSFCEYDIAGYTDSQDGDVSGNHGGSDFWVVKLNEHNHGIKWQKCLGGSNNEYAQCIIENTDGWDYAVAGYTYSHDGDVSGHHGGSDCWVVRLNYDGGLVWQKCLGGTGDDEAYSIIQTADNGFMVAGYTESTDGDVSGHHGGKDFWVVKLDSAGEMEWQKCLGGSGDDVAQGITTSPDGGYVVAGRTESCDGDVSGNHGRFDYWVVKLDSAGEMEWQKCLGGSEDDYAQGIIRGMNSAWQYDGGYIVAGWTASFDGDVSGNHGEKDFWVVRLSPDGLPAPPLSPPTPSAEFDLTRNVVAQTENNTFTAGMHTANPTYLLHTENTDPFATLGNLTCVAAVDNITWVSDEQYATWNTTRAVWTLPPEYTIPAGSGWGTQAGTSYSEETRYNHTCTRTCNTTVFRTDGVQHTNISVTFDALDVESVGVGFAAAQDANVSAEIIPESVVTNAPLAEPLPAGGPYLLKLDTAGLAAGCEYCFSFDTRICLNGSAVVHTPMVYVQECMCHDSAEIGETYLADMPASMLPADAAGFMVETNTSCDWTVVRHTNLLSIQNGGCEQIDTPLPVANFTAAPENGPAPLAVLFTDTSENADTWLWDFGDGATSSEQNPVHIYGAGVYSVTLTVSNPAGSNTRTCTDSVTVLDVPAQSGSSGGGNGHGTTTVSATEIIRSGIPVAFEMDNGPARTAEITFSNNLSSILVTVHTGTTLPPDVHEKPKMEVYRYLKYTLYRASPDDVAWARIAFAVPLPLLSNGDTPLLRYADGKWTELPTVKTGEENGNALFSAESPTLSTFAIAFRSPAGVYSAEVSEDETTIDDDNTGAEEEIIGDMRKNCENATVPLPTTTPGFCVLATIFSLAAAGRLRQWR